MANYMRSYSGKKIFHLQPQATQFCLEDIAHALSQICRFTGHCSPFYSVAEHCIRVADLLPEDIRIHGLLHDAAEAYISDITTAFKKNLLVKQGQKTTSISVTEECILFSIYESLGLRFPDSATKTKIAYADEVMLVTEARDLMKHCDYREFGNVPPLSKKIEPYSCLDMVAKEYIHLASLFLPDNEDGEE